MKRRNGCWNRLLFFCLAAALVLPLAAQPSRADFLVQPDGYWRLEETITATTVVVDERSLTNGTCSEPACPASAAGQIGNGFLFDGVNDTVTFPGAGDDVFDFDGAVGFTIEMWVKRFPSVTVQEAFIGRRSGATGAVWFVGLDSSGRATCDFWDADGPFVTTQFSGGTVIADNEWHHVAVVRDGVNDRMMIYVDGELDAISDQSGHDRTDGSFASTAAVTLGQLNDAIRYRGVLDNLAVYRTRALSALEIRQHYLNGLNSRTLSETFAPDFVGGAVVDTAAVGFPATWTAQAAANPLPSYAGANLPAGAEIDSATGEINWLPLDTQVGPNPFTVSATNTQGTANQSWAIEVEDLCASALDGYWKLDALQPTTPAGTFRVLDELGVSDGTCTLCPQLVDGRVGNGLNFAGGNFTVTFPGAADDVFDFDGAAGFTIEMWVKRPATITAQEAIIGRRSGATGAVWFVGLDSSGRATCDFWDEDGPFVTTQFSGGTVIADDEWHHVAVVRDGVNDRMMIYVDGELDAISDQRGHDRTDGSFASTAPVTLGQLNNGLFFGGTLDELAVYNTALSPTIIAQHFNAAVGQYYCSTGAPAITSTAVMTATEGVPYTYQAAATSPGGPVVWSLLTAPAGMAISGTGLVTWTPGGDADEQTAVEIQAAVFGVTTTQAFTITVTLTNNPPVITSTALTTATVGALYSYNATATDADGDTLTWSLTGAPAGMAVNAATGAVTWTPAAGSEGDVTYTLTVSDGRGGTATQAVTVTVSAAAVPPPASGGGGGGGCFINALGF